MQDNPEWTAADLDDTYGMTPEEAEAYRKEQDERLSAIHTMLNEPWSW